jgi:hypothetical protein
LESVLCMRSSGISGHSQIMPDFPPLRQPELASFRVPFLPRLKPGVYWLFLSRKSLKNKGKQMVELTRFELATS